MADKKEKGKGEGLAAMAVEGMPKMKPTMHLDGEDCVDGAQVGDEETLSVKAKCVGISEDNDGGGDSRRSQRWEIQGIRKAGDDAKGVIGRKVQTRKGW